MESLELPRLFLHHLRASSALAPTRPHSSTNSRFLPQLGFPSKLKNPTLRSISGASQDGPISFEDETQQLRHDDDDDDDDDKARLLSTEIDHFGSLVAFRLTPHDSGIYLSMPFFFIPYFARLIQFPFHSITMLML